MRIDGDWSLGGYVLEKKRGGLITPGLASMRCIPADCICSSYLQGIIQTRGSNEVEDLNDQMNRKTSNDHYCVFDLTSDCWTRGSSRRNMSTANRAAYNTTVSVSQQDSTAEEQQKKKIGERKKLTNHSKRQIRPVQQHPLLIRADHILAHMPQLGAARRGAHERDAAKRQTREFRLSRRRFVGCQLGDEVCCEGELDEGFDVEEDFEPGLG